MSIANGCLTRFQRWFVETALPLWATHGYDHGAGGFFEALNFDASPSMNRPRRVRTQARQVHTFSQASLRGWHPEAATLAQKGFDYLLGKACPEEGVRGCVHLVDDHGVVSDDRRDLYDQAFLLLACASRWEAAKDERALALAHNSLAFLDRELASPHGGWLESDRKELPRRQNPHMHLFEAFMALYRVTGDETFLACADRIHALFCEFFHDANAGVIREFFTGDWRQADVEHVEPGHMLEWVWLLDRYHEIRGDGISGGGGPERGRRLFERALALGADPAFHGFVDNVARLQAGEGHATNGHGAKRLWPQTEYVRASLVLLRCGVAAAEHHAAQAITRLFGTYINSEADGLWIDEFDASGAAIATEVPASILYHLFEAVAETERVSIVHPP